jgi:DNA polymerase-3 subunit delta
MSPPADPLDKLLAAPPAALYLLVGDPILVEPAATRLGAALAERSGSAFVLRRRPADLRPLLEDLRTFALFGGGKVIAAVETAALADRSAAVELLAEAIGTPPPTAAQLSVREREAASRLLQALFLFGIDPAAGQPEDAVAELPDWALAGKPGGRLGKKEAEARRQALAALLAAALREDVAGLGEAAVAQLADLLRRGLPAGHALILAERSVAKDHPLVVQLAERGLVVSLGGVTSDRDGFGGLDALATQLESELGVGIQRDALAELGRRTLRQEEGRGPAGGGGAGVDSTARFASEYRKLADLAAGAGAASIDRALVQAAVEDRGEEDVWKLLDALAEGRAGEALGRLERLVAGSDDPMRARLAFFSLLAGFCRQLVAVRGMVERLGAPRGERNYNRFKDQVAPRLAGEMPGMKNPLAGIHPFRLHRAYLAACRLPMPTLLALPARLLDVEMALKGEGASPQAALGGLVGELAVALRS